MPLSQTHTTHHTDGHEIPGTEILGRIFTSAFTVFQYSVVLPNFSTESIKQSKAQIERPQSARDAPCHIPMVTQTGSALWLALAGGHHRVTAVISKAKVVGGQSSVVLSNHHRGARKTA